MRNCVKVGEFLSLLDEQGKEDLSWIMRNLDIDTFEEAITCMIDITTYEAESIEDLSKYILEKYNWLPKK